MVDRLGAEEGANAARMPFVEHLRELRGRIGKSAIIVIVLTGVAFAFREYLFDWICAPLAALPEQTQKMQVLGLVEMFVSYLKLSVVAGIFAAAPFWLYQGWRFVAPGLYTHERRWLFPFVGLGSLFFVGGGVFAFYVVLPFGFDYLVEMVPQTVEANYRVAEYITFVLRLLIAFGIVFELPLVMWIMSAAGIVAPKTFARFRKYWIVLSAVIGALLTPPDPMTQMMMAVPLVLFFEVGLVGARILYRKRHEPAPLAEDQPEG